MHLLPAPVGMFPCATYATVPPASASCFCGDVPPAGDHFAKCKPLLPALAGCSPRFGSRQYGHGLLLVSAVVLERAAVDLAALWLPSLSADGAGAMSALANFDRALPSRMTLRVVITRHLTAQCPDSGMPSTPRSAGQGGN